jgi:peptidoglycan hydrolase-like protein with peptidoglycan-binding domain
MEVLRSGMRGPLVREAQGLLNSYFGRVKLEPDCRFGRRTEEIVKEFQTLMKLEADGSIGPSTWSALRSRGQPTAACASGVDLFDIRELERFFESLRSSLAPQAAMTAGH